MFKFIKNNPGNRLTYISKKLHIPNKTLERWIKTLREKGKIEFKGAPKTGGYIIKK